MNTTPDVKTPAASDDKAARRKAILGASAAKGRETMATLLADATEMSVEAAIALLAAAPAPTKEAKKAAAAASVPIISRLPIERLDRSRPHGEVHGDTVTHIAFTQHSMGIEAWPYDAHGDLIESALTDAQKVKLRERRERAAKQAKDSVGKAPVVEEDDPDDYEPEAPAPQQDLHEDVNLELWLKREARYKAIDLFNAVKKRYGVSKSSLPELARWLVEDKRLLPRQLVHPDILPPLPIER